MCSLKRTVTEQSSAIETNKKINCSATSTKNKESTVPVMEVIHSDKEQARTEFLERMSEAPAWFKETFSFMCYGFSV